MGGFTSSRISPGHAPMPPRPGLAAALLPAKVEVRVGADGAGLLRDEATGRVFEGPFAAAPPPVSRWRIMRLDDVSDHGRHFGVHDPAAAPVLVPTVRLFRGGPGIATVEHDKSGFVMRFDWRIERPVAMFAVLEASIHNNVISESINRMDDPIPDLGNILDFATSTQRENPVPVAFQNGNGTAGRTPLVLGQAYVVAAIWAANETFVRVNGVVEGHESGLTNGYVADSLSLLNNPTVRHGQNRWRGHLAEYLLIAGPLSEGRIRHLEQHLAARWGVTLTG